MDEPLPADGALSRERIAPSWQAILGAGSPRAVLARLIEGDPLDLIGRCRARLEDQALLLELKRLYLRTAAHVARNSGSYAGTPHVDVWIAGYVRRALKELVQADEHAFAIDPLGVQTSDERILALADCLGIEPGLVLRGCAAFNQAPYHVRSAFVALVIRSEEVAVWARANNVTEAEAKALVRRALWLLGLRGDLDLDEFIGGGHDEP